MSERLQNVTSGASEPKLRGFQGWMAGRARRKEYWLWVGPITIAMVLIEAFGLTVLTFPLGLVMLFIWIRRLHDLGHSGWWAPVINLGVAILSWLTSVAGAETGALLAGLLSLAPILVLGILPGEASVNEYGPPVGVVDVKETFG
jgi:uncharacterized membrane protein YhaH (DUF805 family)